MDELDLQQRLMAQLEQQEKALQKLREQPGIPSGSEKGLAALIDAVNPKAQSIQRLNAQEQQMLDRLAKAEGGYTQNISNAIWRSSPKESIENKMATALQLAQKKEELKPTDAEKEVDKQFAKNYSQFELQGGKKAIENDLKSLGDVISTLKTGKDITGPSVGTTPDIIKRFTNPKSIETQEKVANIVQRSLRETLGAQFTEKEAKQLIDRAYNQSMSQEENARRVKMLAENIKAGLKAKKAAGEYFKKNRTMRGYQGPSEEDIAGGIYSLNFDNTSGAVTKQAPPVGREQIMEELQRRQMLRGQK